MKDPKNLSINMATVREQWNLKQCLEGIEAHGLGGIAPWRDKIAEVGLRDAAGMIADSGLEVTGLCRAGLFASADARARQARLDDNRRAVDEAAEIGAACLIIVAGGLAPGSKSIEEARRQVWEGTAALLEHARPAGVRLAIEPLHPMYAADRSCINTLAQANDLCEALGEGIGVAIDVYHLWWDPDLERELHRAGPERLLAFHISDWLVPTRDLLLDRGMMGDGVIDIAKIRGWVEAAGFTGLAEVEIFSAENWWKRDPDEVVRIAIERFQNSA